MGPWKNRTCSPIGLIVGTLVAAVVSSASCKWPAGEPQAPLLEGNAALPGCGFSLAPEPSSSPQDPCRAGSLVFGPETFAHGSGAPSGVVRTFSVSGPGAICVLVDNRSNSSATIQLDGNDLVTPDDLNPQVDQLTVTSNVDAGSHELVLRPASSPSSELVVEVRFVNSALSDADRVVGDKSRIAVRSLADSPDPFTPSDFNGINDTTTLSAMAQVLRFDGAPSFLYGLRYVFQITDPNSCRQIRAVGGHLPLDPSVRVAGIPISVHWDGRDDSGELVSEGSYYYRVVVSLLRRNPGAVGHVLDTVSSLVQTVSVGSDPSIDDPELSALEELAPEIVQVLPPLEGDPVEVEEPIAESSPGGDVGGDGDSGAKCYLEDCDRDGDGYASTFSTPVLDCRRIELPPEDTGGKGVCPSGWVQYSEPNEYDQIQTEDDEQSFWSQRVRPHIAQHWFTRFIVAGYWISSYATHHPHRAELPDNYVDDNNNGLIDETTVRYYVIGRSSAPGSITLRANVNDKKIRANANVIATHVIDLADIDCPGLGQGVRYHPALEALRVGSLSYYYSGTGTTYTIGPVLQQNYYWYGGDKDVQIDISGLPQGTGVYLVALTYHHLGITSLDPLEVQFQQLKCIESSGAVTSSSSCAKAGRIASQIYITATGRDTRTEEKLRKWVGNLALHEWSLSEHLGMVGGPESAGAAWEDGTRYDAEYGELWCTEFTAMLYRWTLSEPGLFGSVTAVQHMIDTFGEKGWLDLGDTARDSISILDPTQYGPLGPALPGDYLALATREEDEKNHSSVFLWNSGIDGSWKIGGNEDRRVKLTCNYNYRGVHGHHMFKAVGHISNLQPSN